MVINVNFQTILAVFEFVFLSSVLINFYHIWSDSVAVDHIWSESN